MGLFKGLLVARIEQNRFLSQRFNNKFCIQRKSFSPHLFEQFWRLLGVLDSSMHALVLQNTIFSESSANFYQATEPFGISI